MGPIWVEARPALFAGDLVMPTSQPDYVTPPRVKRTTDAFPTMHITYVFEDWAPNSAVKLGLYVDGEHMRSVWGTPATASSLTSRVAVVGGWLTVKVDAADPVKVDVEFRGVG